MSLRNVSWTVASMVAAACWPGIDCENASAQESAATAVAEIYLDEPAPAPRPVVVTTGKLQDKYEEGALRIEREVLKMSDDQIVNHGLFTEYYPNGQKFAEGTYKNGVHDGPWTFWHPNGQICKKVTFKDGRADGAWEVYREDGTLLAKRAYKNNLREGAWFMYYDDGTTVRVEDTYVDGVHDGVGRVYYANGKVQREMSFKKGQLDGVMTEWDESGRKIAEVSFKEGKRHGRFVLYRADGSAVEQMYQEGRLAPSAAGG